MKGFLIGFAIATTFWIALFVWLHAKGRSPAFEATKPGEPYQAAKDRPGTIPPDGKAEEWIAGVRNAFTPFEADRAAEYFPKVYAEDFYFRDAFHAYTNRDELVAYMVRSAEMSPGVTFRFEEATWDGPEAWLPWVMVLANGQESIGVSRFRFNEEGQVIFHQDYWDSADVLVRRVPVANGIIELVKKRF